MSAEIKYFVDNQEFASENPVLTVADILGRAKKPADRFYLVAEKDKTEYTSPEQQVRVEDGERFITRPRKGRPADAVIHYKVNGEPQETREPVLSVEAILRNAGAAAGVAVGDINYYTLEYADKDRKFTDLADKVTIEEGDEFIAIHVGKTPVAESAACLEQVRSELQDINPEFFPEVVRFPEFGVNSGDAVAIKYAVKVGRRKGETFRIAISFQESGYPEYPPHFVHVADLHDSKLTVNREHQFDGVQWKAFSAPPSDFWDGLPPSEKNMRTYMCRHMLRFWSQI